MAHGVRVKGERGRKRERDKDGVLSWMVVSDERTMDAHVSYGLQRVREGPEGGGGAGPIEKV